jgi:hypothetical protein
VPALGLAGGVFEGKGKDGVALLDGVLAVGLAGVERVVDLVKCRRGRELVYRTSVLAAAKASGLHASHVRCDARCRCRGLGRLTVLERHDAGVDRLCFAETRENKYYNYAGLGIWCVGIECDRRTTRLETVGERSTFMFGSGCRMR